MTFWLFQVPRLGLCLTLPNLGFLWVFFKYPKISKNENLLFFPVILTQERKERRKGRVQREKKKEGG